MSLKLRRSSILLSKLIALTGLVSSTAFAHPGHDHSHWLSDPIHALTLVAILGVAVVGVFFSVKNKFSSSNKEED
ncbi:hypothetical protein MED121_16044 [Marinomonas sp. MED121]|nr:hypothetical protein MED121_16044 [Marinomonas sp. MED121]